MVSSRLLTGALALLAASAVNARVCYPSLSTTVATTSSSAESTSTGESSIATETSASTDATSTEASTTDIVITTTSTAEATSQTTTSAATTTSAPVDNPTRDPCSTDSDCLLSTDPLCLQGLCICVDLVCTHPDTDSCSVDSDCSSGQICENGVCTAPAPQCASAQDCRNLGLCIIFPTLCPCVAGQCSG